MTPELPPKHDTIAQITTDPEELWRHHPRDGTISYGQTYPFLVDDQECIIEVHTTRQSPHTHTAELVVSRANSHITARNEIYSRDQTFSTESAAMDYICNTAINMIEDPEAYNLSLHI